MKAMVTVGLIALLSINGSTPAMAQTGAKEETKKAGAAAKDAAKNTGEAGKHAGKATASAAKKGATSVKKVFTGASHATCADGSRQSGKTAAAAGAACTGHGGVAKH